MGPSLLTGPNSGALAQHSAKTLTSRLIDLFWVGGAPVRPGSWAQCLSSIKSTFPRGAAMYVLWFSNWSPEVSGLSHSSL